VAKDWFVYWEPEQWSTTLNGQISVEVAYIQAQRSLIEASWNLLPESEFADQDLSRITTAPMQVWLRSRVLDPGASPQQQGADVAILEAMLWQLGLSPQWGFPGEDGTRIDSVLRFHQGADCGADIAKPRDIFSVGFEWRGPGSLAPVQLDANGQPVLDQNNNPVRRSWTVCERRKATIEAMVRRFQARSFSLPTGRMDPSSGTGVDGVAESRTIQHLGLVWRDYVQAAGEHGDPEVSPRLVSPDWWQQVAALASFGGDIPYRDTPSGVRHRLDATYTESHHFDLAQGFPGAASGLRHDGFFYAWSEQETGGKVWGNTGFPRTDYRIHEGSGDEEGSMGFNHIVWKRMYGRESSCASNRGYLLNGGQVAPSGSGRNVNLYDPFNSLMAFLAAASDSDCGLSNGLYKALVQNSYTVAIPATMRPIRWCYESVEGAGNGPSCTSDPARLQDFTDTEDAGLNLLGKAVIAYNRGAAVTTRNNNGLGQWSYFQFLLTAPRRPGGQFSPTRFGYWLGVKDKSWALRTSIDGYLPYVTYVWPGAHHPPGHPQAGQPQWCFAYGEREWRAGIAYNQARDETERHVNNRPRAGDVDRRSACQ
jgi:hypothetical protein